jgi:hypothetical protein
LLKFKFTQIFLMGQNKFSKMAEFFEKPADNSANSADNLVNSA